MSKPLSEKHIVVIGGGTGQGRMVGALKDSVGKISAIVTMADDGGSTGRLRKYYHAPAVGDIRNVLTKLGDQKKLITELFPFRYGNDRWGAKAQDVEGHVLGNLILLALITKTGSLKTAIEMAQKELGIERHEVLPSTFDNVILCAEFENGDVIKSQYEICHEVTRERRFSIKRVWLEKEPNDGAPIVANPDALRAISEADDILIGPGALHGSILPNLVIPGIVEALRTTKARKIYLANTAVIIETLGFSLEDHIRALQRHTFPKLIDLMVVNNFFPASSQGPVDFLTTPSDVCLGIPVAHANLADENDVFVHAPEKMKQVMSEILSQ